MTDRLPVSIPTLALVVLTVAVVGALAVSVGTSSASYSPYNAEWDGTTAVRSMADDAGMQVETVHETSAYSSVQPSETVAFVLSPDSAYGSTDATRVTAFVRRGGTLVVADDYGPHANELLRRLNASARLDGRPVRDVQSNYRSTAMPVTAPVADHQFVTGVESVTLNYGTTVEPGDATPLLNTSEQAYLDADRDGVLGPNETLEPRTVATVEQVGEGRVVVVGDASAFINAMLDREGNRDFASALLADHGTLVLDHSHTTDLPPVVLALLVARSSPTLQFGLGTLLVGALVVWSRRPGLVSNRVADLLESVRRSRDGPSVSAGQVPTAELIDYLERQHPDWDRERVERVVAALERRRNR